MAGDGGRKVRVNMSGEMGQLLQFAASPELERLGRAAGRAADGAEKLERSNEKAQQAQERAREQFDQARRFTIEGAATGAVRALGRQGAGAADAFYGGAASVRDSLPGLGAAAGTALGGPAGGFLGKIVGEGAGALIERTVLDTARAREEAIAQTAEAFAPAAAQGIEITKEEYQEVLAQAFLIAFRQIRNEAGARSAAGMFGQ